jgi:hypothetical protein
MRFLAATAVVLACSFAAGTQTGDKEKPKPTARFGIELDIKKFPQTTPKETLGSILKAYGEKQIDYILAHLSDPAFVDQAVATYAGQIAADLPAPQKQSMAFNRLVNTVGERFKEDPSKITDLQRFLQDGEWTEEGNDAIGSLKGLQARRVFMKRIAPERWVLLDREK